MKRLNYLISVIAGAALCATACVDLSPIEEDIKDLKDRMTKVEKMCEGYNSSIEALRTTLTALGNEDYIVSATPVKEGEVVVGYTMIFKSGISAFITCGTDGADGQDGHSPIIGVSQDTDGIWYWTVDGEWLLNDGEKVQAVGHDGKDGEPGADGEDGQDGHSPVIGVGQDTDGILYWTVDGDWLLYNGKKVQAEGLDGEDGAPGTDGEDGHTPVMGIKKDTDGIWYWTVDGEWLLNGGKKVQAVGRDGTNGTNGTNGKDGVTPKLKVESGFWWVSYDNGNQWSKVCAYEDGSSYASVFSAIDVSSDDYVVLTLRAGGTITLPRYKAFSITFSPSASVTVDAGKSVTVNYTITGASSKVIVKALGQDGLSAKVEKTTASAGKITVTASASASSSEVVVLVNDGERTIISSISCTVNASKDLFVDVLTPGFYSISGEELTGALFVPGENLQKASKTVSSGVSYRVTSLKGGYTAGVSFAAKNIKVGTSGTISVSSIGIPGVTAGTFSGSISKKDGKLVWISDNSGHGYVIETE